MAEAFSDEEHAFLRHLRFGELPPRILPEDMVETQETEEHRFRPDEHDPNASWNLRYGGAA